MVFLQDGKKLPCGGMSAEDDSRLRELCRGHPGQLPDEKGIFCLLIGKRSVIKTALQSCARLKGLADPVFIRPDQGGGSCEDLRRTPVVGSEKNHLSFRKAAVPDVLSFSRKTEVSNALSSSRKAEVSNALSVCRKAVW